MRDHLIDTGTEAVQELKRRGLWGCNTLRIETYGAMDENLPVFERPILEQAAGLLPI